VTEKNRNLLVRVGSAVVLLPIVLALLYLGGVWTAVLMGVAAAACAHEYLTITLKTLSPVGWFTVAAAACMPLLPVATPAHATELAVAMTGVVLFAGWTWHLVRSPLADAPVRIAQLLTAFVYASGGLTALAALRMVPQGGWWVMVALVITWGNDTSAYFTGRLLGRHKMYPEVSPNKTWEGFAGGMVGAVAFLFGLRQLFFPGLSVVDCLVLGILGSILGPVGDLSESMLKRAYGVKDSGRIIPGHGGMLDRIDALIFNAPLVLLYVKFGRDALAATLA
jgi:phosphatidate cytidylyltransferase